MPLSVEALGLLLIAFYLLGAVTVSEPGTTFVVGWRPGKARVRRGIDVSLGRPRVIAWGSLLPPLAPAMFACSRVAGWSAHILEQKRTGRLFRPSARYVGPASRPLSAVEGAPVPG